MPMLEGVGPDWGVKPQEEVRDEDRSRGLDADEQFDCI